MARLSLAVAATRVDAAELDRFLESLAAAGLGPDDRVEIAASPAHEGLEEALQERVRGCEPFRLTLHPPTATPMQLWGVAMARAEGTHVGVLDVRGLPEPGWVASWRGAPPDRIVCGPVNPGPSFDSTSWAAYLSEYGQFLAPIDSEALDELPGNNIVFPRHLLPASEVLEQEGFWKTFHVDAMRRRDGTLPLAVANGMAVQLVRCYRLAPYLQRRYLHGRCYGGRRLLEPGAPSRLLCLGFAPAIPWLRIVRVIRRYRSKPSRTGRLTRGFTALLLGEIAWSLGEFLGYARGEADACDRLW